MGVEQETMSSWDEDVIEKEYQVSTMLRSEPKKHNEIHLQELRPEVLAIALMMEQRLREKDAALGESYKNKTHAQLGIPALAKCMQLSISIGNPAEVKKHAVDVANYMMMIAFVEGVLNEEIEIINGEPHH